jgi:TonB family protein
MQSRMVTLSVLMLVVMGSVTGQTGSQAPAMSGDQSGGSAPAIAAVAAGEEQPSVKKRVEPQYPALAMRAGIEGKVWLKVYIDEKGRVEKAVVDSSTTEVLNGSALEAIKGWEFTPAKKDGKAIKAEVIIPFMYKLADSPEYATRDEIMFLQEDVIKLLHGESTESVKTKIGSTAYAVIGKTDQYLPSLFSDKVKRSVLVEGANSKVEYSRLALSDAGDMAFLVLKTKPAKRGERFHTVIFTRSGDGTWSIVAWQAGE